MEEPPTNFKSFATHIESVTEAGEINFYAGPIIVSSSLEGAQDYARQKLPFCKVVGEIIEELPPGCEITHNLNSKRSAIIFLN